MLQGYLHAIGSLSLQQMPDPEPAPGEVVVRVRASLSCGTDLKTYRRGHARLPVPGPFGHEAAGDVIAVGDGVTAFHPGQAVVWLPTAPCGYCEACTRGLENQCLTLFDEIVLGAHADQVLLPRRVVERHLFAKPDHLSYESAALLEPLACVVRGARRLGDVKGRVLIIGVGAIGLLHVAVARELLGAEEIWVVGSRETGLDLAADLGAQRAFKGRIDAVAAALEQAAGPWGIDAVIECTGQAQVWRRSVELVRPGGRVLLFGGLAGGSEVAFPASRIHYDEVALLGSFHYTPADVAQAYDLLAGDREFGRRLSGLITEHRPLSELAATFAALDAGLDAVKIAFTPDRETAPAQDAGGAVD